MSASVRYYQHKDLDNLNRLWATIKPNPNYSLPRRSSPVSLRPRTVANPYVAPRGNRSPTSWGTAELHRSVQASRPSTVPSEEALGSMGVTSKPGEGLEKELNYLPASGENPGWPGKFEYNKPKMGTQGLDPNKFDSTAHLVHNEGRMTHTQSLSQAIFSDPKYRPHSTLQTAGMKTGLTPEYIYQKSRAAEIAFNPNRDPGGMGSTRSALSTADGRRIRKGGFIRSGLGYGVHHRNYCAFLAHNYKEDGTYGNHMNREDDSLDDYDAHGVPADRSMHRTTYMDTHTLKNSITGLRDF